MNKRAITHEEHMRNIAGAVETTRQVPGLVPRPQREFWYFEIQGEQSIENQFGQLVWFIDPPLLKNGGAILEGCELTTPTGRRFRGLSYKGDLEGWRQQVVQGGAGLNVTLGQIVNGALALNDGSSFVIEDCQVKFD